MADLFGDEAPASRTTNPLRAAGVRPWDGCDTTSQAWRAYCEALGFVRGPYANSRENQLQLVAKHRGKFGRAILEEQITIVRRDVAGDIYPRTLLQGLMDDAGKTVNDRADKAALSKRMRR